MKGHVQPGREDMIARARSLIKQSRQRKIPLMIPSIALAEYLADFEEGDQSAQRDQFAKGFFIAPFDTKAAWCAGEIFDRERMRVVRENGTPRQSVHADLKIIATAISHGASCIYTDNVRDFRSLANGKIIVEELPEPPSQQTQMFSAPTGT